MSTPERPGSAVSARSLGAFGAQAAVHLRAAFDRSTHPMLIVDDHRRWITGNGAAGELLGLSPQDVSWRAMDQYTSRAGRRRLEEQWPAFLGSGFAEGWYELGLPDRGQVVVEFSAIAHVLVGRHLVVFIVPDEASPSDAEGRPVEQPAWAALGAEVRDRPALTRREREVITMLAAGGRTTDVAEQLVLSSETVKSHVHNAMVKLRARTRAHAVALALVTGQITWAPCAVADDGQRPV